MDEQIKSFAKSRERGEGTLLNFTWTFKAETTNQELD
jgi:hypothetical protein